MVCSGEGTGSIPRSVYERRNEAFYQISLGSVGLRSFLFILIRTLWEAKIMQKITSAYANKMLRSLEEDKAFWVNKEASSSTYVAAVNEEPVIPEYNYMTVAHTIDEIDRKIIIIKHALNLTNATAKVQVGEQEMSIDSILVRMAQLNKRKAVLDDMRKRLPKTRVYGSAFSSSGSAPEYKYINYDPELIRQEYDRISNMIMDMQIALDRYNQTVLFEVDI